jgi:hypothetical protein
MNPSATITLFLLFGDPKRVRTAEISNWSGKAVAAPRSDLDELLARPELKKAGVYVLTGEDAEGKPSAYIGEGEVVLDRIKKHRGKEYWNSAIVFVSKDEHLTKAHIRYLEGKMISEANKIGRYKLMNLNESGAHLPESDQHNMEVFLERIAQLLPVLGSELLTPITPVRKRGQHQKQDLLFCKNKDAEAKGFRSPNGFVVLSGSTAQKIEHSRAKENGAWIVALRAKLINQRALIEDGKLLKFTRDVEFASPSAAAGVIRGGTAAGPILWKNAAGKTLKQLDSES